MKMTKLTINISEDELKRLNELAAARSKPGKKSFTVEACIRDFARTCQPGGSGWKVPGS